MPGPCSGKKFDINFGNRLYSKEERPGSLGCVPQNASTNGFSITYLEIKRNDKLK